MSKKKPKVKAGAAPKRPPPAKASAEKTKKAFGFSQRNVYVVDPVHDVCIAGGKTFLPPEEQGPLDTEFDPGAPGALADRRRLTAPLGERFIRSIHENGAVDVVKIKKIDGVATIVDGRRTIRAARRSNRRREREGQPLLKILAQNELGTGIELTKTMLIVNNHGKHDDPVDLAEKAISILRVTHDKEGVAQDCNLTVDRLNDYLLFYERASERLREAVSRGVEDGGVSFSVAWEIAKFSDAGEQGRELDKILASHGAGAENGGNGSGGNKKKSGTARGVRARLLLSQGKIPPLGRKTQQTLIAQLDSELGVAARRAPDPERANGAMNGAGGASGEGDLEFLRGARAALLLCAGSGEISAVDPRLRKLVVELGPAGAGTAGAEPDSAQPDLRDPLDEESAGDA